MYNFSIINNHEIKLSCNVPYYTPKKNGLGHLKLNVLRHFYKNVLIILLKLQYSINL